MTSFSVAIRVETTINTKYVDLRALLSESQFTKMCTVMSMLSKQTLCGRRILIKYICCYHLYVHCQQMNMTEMVRIVIIHLLNLLLFCALLYVPLVIWDLPSLKY